jgi:uncharacterized protein YbaA (DUF1428 family)
MPEYVDGFVIPLKKSKLADYLRIAREVGKIWKECGALDYRECIGDDLKPGWGVPFPKVAGAKPDETIIFSWITFKSRKDRDRVNAKVMADPRVKKMMDPNDQTFDCKRMAYGGFKTIMSM